MAPRIVLLGAGSGLVALLMAIGTFFLPLPLALKALLYLIFGGVFLVSVVLFGRIMVMDG